MGNEQNITRSCMHVGALCEQEYDADGKPPVILIQKQKVKSSEEIKRKITAFIQQNRLNLYSMRERKVFQTLVSVDQQHVGTAIIELDKKIKSQEQQLKQLKRRKQRQNQNNAQVNNNTERQQEDSTVLNQKSFQKLKSSRNKLFEEAQCLLLQDLDMIFQQIGKFNTDFQSSSIKFNPSQSTFDRQTKKLTPSKATIKSKNEQKLKSSIQILDKKQVKKSRSIVNLGNQIMANNQLLIIVPVECFNGIGALRNNKHTGLPSNTTLIQLFFNKVKAVNRRRNCQSGLIFLVNEQFTFQLQNQLSAVQGIQLYQKMQRLQVDSNLQNHGSEDGQHQPIRYTVIPFKNSWPLFSESHKISISKDLQTIEDLQTIDFCFQEGDLIAFIQNSMQVKSVIQKYKYIHITNINNMLSQIGDSAILGFLQSKEEIDIAAKLLKPQLQQTQLSSFFALDQKGFVETITPIISTGKSPSSQQSGKYISNDSFLNIEDYWIKSRFFTSNAGPLKRLLMSRIKRQVKLSSDNETVLFNLKRDISDILLSKFTAFIMVQEEYQFSHVQSSISGLKHNISQNGQIGYSRYCKKLLGIKNSQPQKQTQQLVQIDAGILHKGSTQLIKLIKKLSAVRQIGFPIILYSDFSDAKPTTQ